MTFPSQKNPKKQKKEREATDNYFKCAQYEKLPVTVSKKKITSVATAKIQKARTCQL